MVTETLSWPFAAVSITIDGFQAVGAQRLAELDYSEMCRDGARNAVFAAAASDHCPKLTARRSRRIAIGDGMEQGSISIAEGQCESRTQDGAPRGPGLTGEPRAEQIGMAQRVSNRYCRDPCGRCEFSVIEHALGNPSKQSVRPKYLRASQIWL
jgi:hypothetical protein